LVTRWLATRLMGRFAAIEKAAKLKGRNVKTGKRIAAGGVRRKTQTCGRLPVGEPASESNMEPQLCGYAGLTRFDPFPNPTLASDLNR